MAVSLGEGLLGVTVLAGAVLCWMGYYSYRRWNEPGVTAFSVFLLGLGLGGVVIGALSLVGPVGSTDPEFWGPIGVILWGVAALPWMVFALQYTGTFTRVDRRAVLLLAAPAAGFPFALGGAIGLEGPFVTIVGSLSVLYVLALMIVGCYLVVRTTYRFGHLSVTQGLVLAAGPVVLFVSVNSTGSLVTTGRDVLAAGVYAAGFVLATTALALSIFRYDTFQSAPAAGKIGERTIVRETDDLLFVADDDGRVIRLNETAATRLGVSRAGVLGDSIRDLLGLSIAELDERETIELRTTEGRRQFDVLLSGLTDQHDRQIGYTLSLHDVTELELREQRLEVLNRVLRHNLRNQVEVIKSNAEVLAEQSGNGYADSIIDSAERLSELGRSARAIDRVVSRPPTTAEVDLVTVVRSTLELHREGADVDLSVSLPEEARVVTDRQAFSAAAESGIENAISHADETVAVRLDAVTGGYRLTVADDGPGIPDDELASVTAGTETALKHATGLGLWQLKWGVTKLNGTLSIDTDEGTTVEITIPDQRQ